MALPGIETGSTETKGGDTLRDSGRYSITDYTVRYNESDWSASGPVAFHLKSLYLVPDATF